MTFADRARRETALPALALAALLAVPSVADGTDCTRADPPPAECQGGGASAKALAVAALAVAGAWYALRKVEDARAERRARSEADPVLSRYDDNRNERISCREARRHGIAPVGRGHEAYAYMRDRDGDGFACGKGKPAHADAADTDPSPKNSDPTPPGRNP